MSAAEGDAIYQFRTTDECDAKCCRQGESWPPTLNQSVTKTLGAKLSFYLTWSQWHRGGSHLLLSSASWPIAEVSFNDF